MAKRKRKPNRARTRQNRTRIAPKNSPGQKATKPEKGEPSGADQTNTGNQAQEPQYRWVTVEHRDADGNLTLPKETIASTYPRRYEDVPHGTEIKVLVLAGYKPKALIMVERKIYEIHRLSVQGWRRSGQIAVELDGWRHHEADWFNAMRGVRLEISDPGLPGPHNEKSDYIVSESSFDRKIVKLVGENDSKTEVQIYEGTLDITETWKSAWRRQAAEVLDMGFKYLLLPVLSALVAGLAVWWIGRSPSPDGHDSETLRSPAEHGVQAGRGDSVSEPSDKLANRQSSNVPVRQTASDKQDSTNSKPEGDSIAEGSTPSGNEEVKQQSSTNPAVEGHTPELPRSAKAKPVQVKGGESPDNE